MEKRAQAMSGSKRRRDKGDRKRTRILGIIAVGLAIVGFIYVLNLGGYI